MSSGADRITEFRQKGREASNEGLFQRADRPLPVAAQFRRQHEKPSPAIGPLESGAQRARKIGKFSGDLFGHESVVEQSRNVPCPRHFGKQPAQPCQHPIAVHAAVPIEAAEENRMKLARRACIVRSAQHMIEFVGVFFDDMVQRDSGIALGKRDGETGLGHGGHR